MNEKICQSHSVSDSTVLSTGFIHSDLQIASLNQQQDVFTAHTLSTLSRKVNLSEPAQLLTSM